MTPIISIDCTCGRQIRATDPIPGQTMRCLYCGATEVFQGDGPLADSGDTPTGPLEMPDLDLHGEVDLTCPACGASMEAVWKSGSDKVARCAYCGKEVDLPEKRGFTRERISRGPGSHTVERVTQWFEEIGDDDHIEPTIDPEDAENAVVDFYGETFDGLDEFEQMLASRLPAEQARRMIAELRSSIKSK